jgi:nucleoside phosphorylase
LSEAAGWESEILARQKRDLKNKRLVIVVGAGVTLNATADASGRPLSRITWTGLIRNGLEYLVNNGYVEASSRRKRRAYEAFEDPNTDSLLEAANILSSQLNQHGQFPTWLETVFVNLDQEIRHPAIFETLKVLHENGATLLTTNYDDLLEKYCDIRHIGRSNQDEILKFKRGDLDGIFHVHGSYHDPHEVVLDTTDYYEMTHSDEVQNVLKTFLEYKTMIFIGYGSGMEDPNFDALLKWASERQKNIPNRHCLLIRDGDNPKYKPLVRLKYGPGYQNLAPYLNKLLDEAPTPADITADIPLFMQNINLGIPTTRKYQDYTVGWICALPTEMAAAVGMLDEHHNPLQQDPYDHNTYTLGRIGGHNIAIACLPAGVTGTISAAKVATQMLSSFKGLKFGLMVGIGGGVPSEDNDIRLGDVVVSKPTDTFGGVIQYDFGKTVQDGHFKRTGSLNRPPDVLLTALANLQARHMREGHRLVEHLADMTRRYPRMAAQFACPGAQHDLLYEAEYDHPEGNTTCSQCDSSRLMDREPRLSADSVIYYGSIASGDQVMRHGATRDRLRKELDVLCFEMEAAGLMDSFPCLVIRGICDYADSHKNKHWQSYAAANAAAYAKDLLCHIPGNQVFGTQTAAEMTTAAGELGS